jgi:hypothetical protein
MRCRTCSLRAEVEGHEQAIVDRERLRLERRAQRQRRFISRAHAIVWFGCAAVLQDSFGGALRAWVWPIAVAGFALAIALYLRRKWAYYATLALDGAAAAAPLVAAACSASGDGWILAAFVALIPSLLAADLVWRRRSFGLGEAAEPAPTPAIKKWEAPGRQL